jgi:hypothetical protein
MSDLMLNLETHGRLNTGSSGKSGNICKNGFLFAFFSDLKKYGIGNYPLTDTLIMTVHNIILWTVLGLVISLFIKPIPKKVV